jgi:hypothetical protein
VERSIAVKRCVFPAAGQGKGPSKSTCTWANCCSSRAIGCGGDNGCPKVLCLFYSAHNLCTIWQCLKPCWATKNIQLSAFSKLGCLDELHHAGQQTRPSGIALAPAAGRLPCSSRTAQAYPACCSFPPTETLLLLEPRTEDTVAGMRPASQNLLLQAQ